MPRRAPAQQLDRMAREAFRFLMPQRWSYRSIGPDYGIGGKIEILDATGRATGLGCRVHLTGTDEPDLADALTLRLPAERIEYYASLDPTVLMVRYHAATGRFYARWALRHDPQGDTTGGFRGRGKSLFRWAVSDVWDGAAAPRLERDLHLLRQLGGPGFAWPLRFTLNVETHSSREDARAAVVAEVREVWRQISSYVALVEDPSDAHGSITLSPTMIRATIGGLHAVTIHPSEPFLEGEELRPMVVNLPVLIAVALTRAGQVEAAARLCRVCAWRLRPQISS